MSVLSSNKLEAQARACADVVAQMLWCTLVDKRPLDRALAAHFHGHKEFGSRDRRLFAETVFSALRWWGWFQRLAPKPFLEARARADRENAGRSAESADNSTSAVPSRIAHAAWYPLLLAAHLMECQEENRVADLWAQALGVDSNALSAIRQIRGITERGRRILAAMVPGAPSPETCLRDLMPSWLLHELDPPCAVDELLEWLQKRPPVWLRAQTDNVSALLQELRAANLAVEQHAQCPQAVKLETPRVNLRALAAFRSGRFEIQDFASQMIGLVCSPGVGERWWDACAGAGGKALHLALLMERKGTVVASDIRTYKLKDLRLRARRARLPNIECREWNGKALSERRANFHGVLVDVPCSCSGTWRRNPDARWNVTPGEIEELTTLQRRLLRNAASGLRPGGTMVYATCSMFERENQQVIASFLADSPEFELCAFAHPINGRPSSGMLQIWPWDADCDAMFVAKMVKRT